MPAARPANFVIQKLFHTLPKNLGQDLTIVPWGTAFRPPRNGNP